MAAEKLDTLQTVELAEGVEIRLRIAGPVLRIGAYLIDIAIRAVALMIAFFFLNLADLALGDSITSGLSLVIWFLIDWFYPVFFEGGKWGATPGKRAVGLRVVQANGSPITIGQAVVRNFLRFVDMQPLFTYGLGMGALLGTKRFQRLGDLAAGTVVVYTRVQAAAAPAVPPPVAALPLPVGLSADETRALVMFRERSGLWSEARRAEIADQASALSGAGGATGVSRLMSMAFWVQEKRERGS